MEVMSGSLGDKIHDRCTALRRVSRLMVVTSALVQTGCAISYVAADKDGRMTTFAFGFVKITQTQPKTHPGLYGLSVESFGVTGTSTLAGCAVGLGYSDDTVFAVENGSRTHLDEGQLK